MLVKNFLLLLFLCLSLHACNARRFAHKKLEQKFQSSDQNDQKGLSVTPKESSPFKNDHAAAAKEDRIAETPVDNYNTQKLKASKGAGTKKLIKDKKAKKSGAAIQNESLVSASWRLPQIKHRGKHLGFSLDYSMPRTHPPRHN